MSSCQITPINSINFPVNILTHVTILFSFLTIIFIVYISKVEKSAFHNEISNNIQDGMQSVLNNPSINKRYLQSVLKRMPLDTLINLYNNPTEYSSNNNTMLFTQAIIVMVGLVLIIISIIVVSYLSCNKCVPVWPIAKENILTFILVGIIEFLFFYFVALHYIPIKPSTITYTVIDALKNL